MSTTLPRPRCVIVPEQTGKLSCRTCGETFDPRNLDLTGARRQEGGSDPEYQCLQVQFTPPCPEGTGREQKLSLGYGPTASRADSLIVERLQL